MPGITQTILTRHLRQLEKDKIVQRKVYAEVPPRVEYSLTEMGQGIQSCFRCCREMGSGLYQAAKNVEVLTMYQELLRKITEEKPSYSREEIQWLLEHLGDPSPEIRDDLVFTSLARGIQEELFTREQFHFIAEGISSDGGLDKEIDKVGLSTLERSFRALIYANLLSADANQQSIFYQGLKAEIRNVLLNQGLILSFKRKRIQQVFQVSMVGFMLLHMEPIY